MWTGFSRTGSRSQAWGGARLLPRAPDPGLAPPAVYTPPAGTAATHWGRVLRGREHLTWKGMLLCRVFII